MSALPPKADISVGQLDVGKRPKSNSDALDIAHCRTNLLSVGLDRSRPAYPRHFAQALHFSPPAGRRTFGKMSVPKSFVWMRHWIPGLRQPPVSCRVQPSVVSTPKEMRYVLR